MTTSKSKQRRFVKKEYDFKGVPIDIYFRKK